MRPPTVAGASAHDALRDRLARDGILYAGPDQAIRHLSGALAPWAFYSWGVTLTGPGLELAARALLERLATFHSTQLAAYGQTAQPLLAACLLLGDGRYTGLSIRKERKTSVTGRQVDGPLDRRRSVVILDDSIVSGRSLEASVRALEADGFEVEGALALVEFPGRGGVDWAWSNGYRVESLFDIWRDLGMAGPPFRPPEGFAPGQARVGQVPDGLSPPEAARWIAHSFLRTGVPPAPPRSLDRAYEAPGGVFVSFRRRVDDQRLARDGFWRFGPIVTTIEEDLVYATVHTLANAGGAITPAILDRCKIAVTWFGPLLPSRPADLDFDRYGIVVRDQVSGHKLGGALPNTQVFSAEAGQYWQARVSNARLGRTEAHDLFRHELNKVVEPGETWLSFGQPDGPELAWRRDPQVGAELTDVARAACLEALATPVAGAGAGTRAAKGTVKGPASGPATDDAAVTFTGAGVHAVGVSIYDRGHLGSGLAEAEADGDPGIRGLVALAARRAADAIPAATRSGILAHGRAERLVVSVVALHDREDHGQAAGIARFKVRPGLDAITVRSSAGARTLLPAAGPYNGWGPGELVARLRATAAGTAPDARWSTSRAASWVARPGDRPTALDRLEFGFTVQPTTPPPDGAVRAQIEALATHLLRRIGPSGLPVYDIDAIRGPLPDPGTTPRVVHALATMAQAGRVLDRADLRDAGRAGLARGLAAVGSGGVSGQLQLGSLRHGPLADCVLLRAALDDPALVSHPAVDALGRRLLGLIGPDGRIARRPVRLGDGQDHEFLPAAVLMALVPWLVARDRPLPDDGLRPQLAWQQRQFRAMHTWAMAGWQPQGWEAVHRAAPGRDIADHVFEIADWAIDRQLTKNGAFLEDLSEKEPSFNTGFIAEGIVAAWAIAIRTGDEARAERYAASWRHAAGFVRSLTLTGRDTFASPPEVDVVGGVRLTPSSARLRIDATSHCLHALLGGYALLGGGGTAQDAPGRPEPLGATR